MRPVLCLITDRQRYADVVGAIRRAAAQGVQIVQLRERDLDGGPLLALTIACLSAVGGTSTRVVVNDRVDVALAAGAHGVHLRADSVSAAAVRRIAPPGFLVGRSVHSEQEAVAAAGDRAADYLMFGTVFPTASKPGRPAAGLEPLRAVVKAVPVLVIAAGGITRKNMAAVLAAGAAGVAGISMFHEGG